MFNILIFGMNDNPGGVESFLMNYARNFDKTKVHMDFLCNTKVVAYENELTDMGCKVIKVTARRDNPVRYKKDMKAFFKDHAAEYDVIWVNLCSLANIDYLKMAKKYGIPVRIIHSHNSRNMDSRLRGILHKINKKKIGRIATDYWGCSYEAAMWFYPDKIINSDFFRHFHQCNVTGIGNCIHCAFHSMSRTKMTSDIIISHMKITTTIIRFLSGKSSCL